MMQPKSAIQKGKELEKFIVERLKLSGLDRRAARNPGSGSGKNKGDIWNALNLCIECKNQKNFNKQWYKQAEKESMGTQEPVVVWHAPQTPLEDSMVFIPWDFFEKILIKSREAPQLESPGREMKWRLKRFVEYGRELLKEFN